MNFLIEYIVSEIRRVLIDRLVNEMIGEISQREFVFFVMGIILTLLMLELSNTY